MIDPRSLEQVQRVVVRLVAGDAPRAVACLVEPMGAMPKPDAVLVVTDPPAAGPEVEVHIYGDDLDDADVRRHLVAHAGVQTLTCHVVFPDTRTERPKRGRLRRRA